MFNINSSPTREKYPLSENKIIKKTITSGLGTFFSLGFIIIVLTFPFIGIFSSLSTNNISSIVETFFRLIWLYPILSFVYIAIVYIYQKVYFSTYYYDVTEDYLVIKKGVFAPSEITIPWERIQDVYVDQDIWDRIFDLFDVHLSTATITSGFSAHIDGVEQQAADGLRMILLEKVRTRISQPQIKTISTINS